MKKIMQSRREYDSYTRYLIDLLPVFDVLWPNELKNDWFKANKMIEERLK